MSNQSNLVVKSLSLIQADEFKPPCMGCGSREHAHYTVNSPTGDLVGRYCTDHKGCLTRREKSRHATQATANRTGFFIEPCEVRRS